MKKEKKNAKDITKCDNLNNVQQFEVQKLNLNGIDIKTLIRVVRGQQVMLDSDLAMLYGVDTRSLNQSVKRHIRRFPDDFMFQLTKREFELLKSQKETSFTADRQGVSTLMSQIVISKPIEKRGGTQKPPYVFTRNGVGMLSSVLRSEIADDVNIRIMRAFTAIPDLINNNTLIMQRILNIEQHQTETDEKVNQILITIEEQAPKLLPEQVFSTGCVWDAWTYISDLIRSAKKRVILIDNYVDDRALLLLDKRLEGVEATIYSRYNESLLSDIQKHNSQYSEIKFIQLPHRNHDRFLIIDEDSYLLGASVKDMGIGLCAITKMIISPDVILRMLK